jgi:hypothetical protein
MARQKQLLMIRLGSNIKTSMWEGLSSFLGCSFRDEDMSSICLYTKISYNLNRQNVLFHRSLKADR